MQQKQSTTLTIELRDAQRFEFVAVEVLLYIDAQRDIEVMSGMTSPWYRIQLDQKHI